jgi:tyrosyl-tRNA synthetase
MINTDKQKIEELLTRSVAEILPSKEELKTKLMSGQKLRIYIGTDATGTSLHLGHSTNYIILEKLRGLGHEVIFLVGDFTSRIGDPTDKSAARVMLTREQVIENTKTWLNQISKIIDTNNPENPVKIMYNHDWLSKLDFEQLIDIAANFTVQQMLERDMFEKRMTEEKPIYIHEFFYPLMQGWDSVAMNVDIELCGNDQKFNAMVGRTLQKRYNNKDKFVFITTLLVNPKTGEKMMSKSLGTGVFLDFSPKDMYGGIMAQPDENMEQLFIDTTLLPLDEIAELIKMEDRMKLKKRLAFEIVKIYHGEEKALDAQAEFERVVQNKDFSEIERKETTQPLRIIDALAYFFGYSKSEARRLIEQNAVEIDGQKLTDANQLVEKGGVLRSGKKNLLNWKIDQNAPEIDLEQIKKENEAKEESIQTSQAVRIPFEEKKIIIESSIFEKFPSFKRGVIIVKNIDNKLVEKDIESLLLEEIKRKQGQGLIDDERVRAWEKAHEEFGSNPNRFAPSIKSLLKRIETDGFPFVNSVVALFNYISIKYTVPCGGDDVDKVKGNLKLGFANGTEKFIGLGSSEEDNPTPGEVIYADDSNGNVMCRRWNWRNGNLTKITPSTKHLVINIDGINPVSEETIIEARDELASLLKKYCGAEVEVDLLDKNKPERNLLS